MKRKRNGLSNRRTKRRRYSSVRRKYRRRFSKSTTMQVQRPFSNAQLVRLRYVEEISIGHPAGSPVGTFRTIYVTPCTILAVY